MNKLTFYREVITHWKEMGAVTPSSRFLVNKIISKINFQQSQLIVELGPGSGVYTKRLLEEMPPDCQLIAFELNPTFCDELRDEFSHPGFTVEQQSAIKLLETIQEQRVDYIISGVPMTLFREELRHELLRVIHESLKPGGRLLNYQYSWSLLKTIKQYFSKVELDFEALNIPPACIYEGVK